MPQDTRRRNEFQGTRREDTEIGRGGTRRYKLMRPRPRGTNVKENMDWVERELEMVWNGLRGGGGAKDIINSGHRLSQALDQYGRPTRLYDNAANVWIEGRTIASTLSDLENDARKIWVPASGVMWNTSLTPPAAWNSTAGGARLGTLDLPQNTSTAMHTHYQAPMPRLWAGQAGTLTATIPYAFSATNANTFSLRTTIWSYASGDALTSPTATEWNETSAISMNLATAEQWFELPQTNTVSFDADADWLSFRITRLGNDAADTFTGTVRILGVLFDLEV